MAEDDYDDYPHISEGFIRAIFEAAPTGFAMAKEFNPIVFGHSIAELMVATAPLLVAISKMSDEPLAHTLVRMKVICDNLENMGIKSDPIVAVRDTKLQ